MIVSLVVALSLSACAAPQPSQPADTLSPKATTAKITQSANDGQPPFNTPSPQAISVRGSAAPGSEADRVVTNLDFIVERAASKEQLRSKRTIREMDVFKLPGSPSSNSVLTVVPQEDTQYRIIVVSKRSNDELWYKCYSGPAAIELLDLGTDQVDVYIQNAEPKELHIQYGMKDR